MKNRILIFIGVFFFAVKGWGQDTATVQQYIATYKDLAISEMLRTGMPASIKLAQGIHETQAGTSELVRKSNNHFGLKCKSTWTGESVSHDDDARGECFRKYNKAEDSYKDQSDYLKGTPRYAFLFQLDPTDYEDWARGLKKAGYATNPRYAQILIKLIEDYHLNDYTLIALGRKQEEQENVAIKTNEVQGKSVQKESLPVEEKKADQQTGVPEQIVQKPLYPDGEFRINETRVIYAKAGTPFLSIANLYNLALARIFDFNDMPQQESVDKDQLVFLQRKRRTGNNDFHVVQPGETLFDIAQNEALRLENLMEYNMLREGQQPAIGEKLYLRTKAPAMPRLALKTNYSIYTTSISTKTPK
jgi:hypothetical protein